MCSKICTSLPKLFSFDVVLRIDHVIFDVYYIQSTLKHRDTIQMEYEVTLEELSRKKTEKEEVQSCLLLLQSNGCVLDDSRLSGLGLSPSWGTALNPAVHVSGGGALPSNGLVMDRFFRHF